MDHSFEKKVGKSRVHLPGNTSCSRDPKVALGFALDNISGDKTPVLFVFAIQNYERTIGMLMNNSAFTAYPEEGEMLLMEGTRVYVLLIESGVKIENSNSSMAKFDGKTITIIHLFNRW